MLTTLLLAGCDNNSPESHIKTAKEAFQTANFKVATIELKNALEKAPDNVEARLLLGQSLHAQEQWAESEKHLIKALELGASPEQVLHLLVRTLTKIGKYQEAIAVTIPLAGLGAQAMASVQAERANAFMLLNKPAQAAQSIEEGMKALASTGETKFSPDLELAKAKLAITNNQTAQAAQFVGDILSKEPRYIEAKYIKAQLLLAQSKEAEAIKEYEQILAAKPSEILAQLAIIESKMRAKDWVGAEKSLNVVEKTESGIFQVKFTRAKLELIKGNLKSANESLQQVLQVMQDHVPSLLLDAAIQHGLGNYEQSLKSANKVLAQIPGHLYSAKLVVMNLLHKGDANAAMQTLMPLLQYHSNDAQLFTIAGEVYMQARQYAKAMTYLDQAAALQPGSADIKQRQALGHLIQGNTGQAMLDLELAISLSDKAGRADLALIMLHLDRKEFDKALNSISVLEKKLPNNPLTHNLRGSALLGKNERPAARKAFEQSLIISADFYPAAANLARMDMADNNPESARKRYEEILKKDERNLPAMMDLAKLAAATHKENDALKWLELAAKTSPRAMAPRADLVRYHLAKNAPQRALTVAREIVSSNPDNPDALILLGSAQLASGDAPTALTNFSRAVEKAPRSAEALYNLGMAQFSTQQVQEGLVSLERAINLQAGHVGALDGLLLADLANKNVDSALRRSRAFQASNPKSPAGFIREADILYSQQQYPQAAKAYEQAFNKEANLKYFAKLQEALSRAGNSKLADQKLADLLIRSGANNDYKIYAAEYHVNRGRYAEAASIYEGLSKALPKNSAIHNNLALVYQKMKDPRALTSAEQALKLAPEHPGIQDTLGWLLVEQGQTARGLDLLRRALTKASDATTLRYHYAAALAKSGKRAEAKNELKALLASNQRFPELVEAKNLLSGL